MYHLLDTDQLDNIRENRIKFAIAADQAQTVIKQMYLDAKRYAEKEGATAEGINTLNYKLQSLVNYFNAAEQLITHLEGIFKDIAWSSGKNKAERADISINDLMDFVSSDINDAIKAGNTERLKISWSIYQDLLKVRDMFTFLQIIPAENIPYIYQEDGITFAQLNSPIVYQATAPIKH
jgi:molecular chaperone DnaK (HSP70)